MQKLLTNQSGYWPEPEVHLVPYKMDTTKRRYCCSYDENDNGTQYTRKMIVYMVALALPIHLSFLQTVCLKQT